MGVGDRSLALQAEPEDRNLLQTFLSMVPRFLRAEVDELVVRIHPLPTLEKAFLAICGDLVARPNKEAAVEEATLLLTAAFRQLGVDKNAAPAMKIKKQLTAREGVRGRDDLGGGGGVSGLSQGGLPIERESGSAVRLLEELFALYKVLEDPSSSGRPGWFGDLLRMDAGPCDRLLARFTEMSRGETQALCGVARGLDAPGLPELLFHMENLETGDGRDALIDAKRRDHQYAMLAFSAFNTNTGAKDRATRQNGGGSGPNRSGSIGGSIGTSVAGGYGPPVLPAPRKQEPSMLLASGSPGGGGYGGYDPSRATDFMAPASSCKKSEVLSVHGMGEDRRFRLEDSALSQGSSSSVVFVDTLSEALGVRGFDPVPLDSETNVIAAESRFEVYQFVALHGHTSSGRTGDKQGSERLAALTQEAELMRAKGRW